MAKTKQISSISHEELTQVVRRLKLTTSGMFVCYQRIQTIISDDLKNEHSTINKLELRLQQVETKVQEVLDNFTSETGGFS